MGAKSVAMQGAKYVVGMDSFQFLKNDSFVMKTTTKKRNDCSSKEIVLKNGRFKNNLFKNNLFCKVRRFVNDR